MSEHIHSSPARGDIALSVESVWKVFGPKAAGFTSRSAPERTADALACDHLVGAVQDASFEIKRGEVFVFMGLSGSGKSTLLRCLTRLIEPAEGRIAFDGKDIRQLGEKALADLRGNRMGMVFQHFALLPNRTVLGNIALPLEMQGMARAKAEARAQELVSVLGLTGREGRLPSDLSGGQQQRVGLLNRQKALETLAADVIAGLSAQRQRRCDAPRFNPDHSGCPNASGWGRSGQSPEKSGFCLQDRLLPMGPCGNPAVEGRVRHKAAHFGDWHKVAAHIGQGHSGNAQSADLFDGRGQHGAINQIGLKLHQKAVARRAAIGT